MTREEMMKALATAVPEAKPAHAPRVKTVTAYWPLPALMSALASAGWGQLSGRKWQGLRSVLFALTAKLDHRTGGGFTTAVQVADSAGLSERWTRHLLNELEELGLITWKRGGIRREVRTASYIKVNKKALAAMVRDARDGARKRWARRHIDFLARLSKLRKTTIFRGKVTAQPALSADHSPLTGEVITTTSAVVKNQESKQTMIERPIPRPSKWVDYCPHSDTRNTNIIHSCPDCRLNSLTWKEEAEYDGALKRYEEELNGRAEKKPATDEEQAMQAFLEHYYPGLPIRKQAVQYAKDLRIGNVPKFDDWYQHRLEAQEVKA